MKTFVILIALGLSSGLIAAASDTSSANPSAEKPASPPSGNSSPTNTSSAPAPTPRKELPPRARLWLT